MKFFGLIAIIALLVLVGSFAEAHKKFHGGGGYGGGGGSQIGHEQCRCECAPQPLPGYIGSAGYAQRPVNYGGGGGVVSGGYGGGSGNVDENPARSNKRPDGCLEMA